MPTTNMKALNAEELRQIIREAVIEAVLEAHEELFKVPVGNKDADEDTSEYYNWIIREAKGTKTQ